MTDFSKYPYCQTLRFFEAYYPYDREDIHYADVMLSMRTCKTIDELIEVRERLKKKIKRIFDFHDIPKEIRAKSYEYMIDPVIMRENVDMCYDENLFRLFKENNITEKSCAECFVNMTYCTPNAPYKCEIIEVAQERAGIDVSELLNSIAKRYREFGVHWDAYKSFEEGMNGYYAAKEAVQDDYEYLKQFNWRLLPQQKTLYSEIDKEEIEKRELHEKLLKDRKEKQECEAKEAEEKKQQKATQWFIVKLVIGVITFVAFIVLIVQIPMEVMNWILVIFLGLAVMKSLLK